MASILVNGFKEHTHNRLLIDEAMMNHFGAIITAALLAKAKELLLIGDINQIPHIDRHNVFPMSYEKPNAVAKVSRELLRSYRNPMDVAYALNEIYSGIYSTQEGTRSLTMDGYDINKLSISLPQTLYLAHTSWQNRAKSHGMRT
ncbi:RNA replication protein, partial [Eumeta japonica]